MHIWRPGRHSEQQSRNAPQERRLASFIITVDHVIVWLCRGELYLAVDKVSEANEIETIDSHRTSEANNRASNRPSASSMAVRKVSRSNLIGSGPSASSIGNFFCSSSIEPQLPTLAASSRNAARILTTSPMGSSRLINLSCSQRGWVASCTRSTQNRPFPHSFAMLIASFRTCSASRLSPECASVTPTIRSLTAVTRSFDSENNAANRVRIFSYTSSAVWQPDASISASTHGTTEVGSFSIEIVPASETVTISQIGRE